MSFLLTVFVTCLKAVYNTIKEAFTKTAGALLWLAVAIVVLNIFNFGINKMLYLIVSIFNLLIATVNYVIYKQKKNSSETVIKEETTTVTPTSTSSSDTTSAS